MQYVRNFDKSIRFNTALNLAKDEKSVSRIDNTPTKKIITYIVIRLFNKQFITMTTSASYVGFKGSAKTKSLSQRIMHYVLRRYSFPFGPPYCVTYALIGLL